MKGRCLPPWGLAGIEASFPSYSTKGPRGPWLDTEDLPWAPTLGDESVTLSSTRARVRLSAVATGAQPSEFRLRTVTPNAGRAGTMVGSRHRKKPSERFLADSRRFLEEEGSGGCVFSGGLRRRRDSQGYSNGLIRTGDTVEIKEPVSSCRSSPQERCVSLVVLDFVMMPKHQGSSMELLENNSSHGMWDLSSLTRG
ncbi:hypothetical protein MJG53_010739 [Ovis ammon polii x Ovis aries]|uniref:Uncharacterized protein n=1 Tax=Ovis ammon polii x Ovis aries TaxID=2918886 RepID=A0ACB9UUQ9_9CETA|nr:hypothetical protein MJG53_010739 [Ovis ammon polii x Ovis aries]